jgi:hypothetical protein
MNAKDIVAARGGQWRGDHGTARCPAHDDEHASLSVAEGKGGVPLVKCHAGCTQDAVIGALRAKALWPEHKTGEFAAIYDYRAADGALVYQVCRKVPKAFVQRRPDGRGGWIWNLKGVEPLPYRLPALLLADPNGWVFISEGETDCDNLLRLGISASCNSGGAGKWRRGISEHFGGRKVAILPDNDNAGRSHAQDVATKLWGIASSIRIVALTGLPPKGDVSDWLASGGTADELRRLAEEAPEWRPGNGRDPRADQLQAENRAPSKLSIEALDFLTNEQREILLAQAAAELDRDAREHIVAAGVSDGAGDGADPSHSAHAGPAVRLEDFVAYMPEHKYIFRPTRQLWPGASVNARLPPIPVGDHEISATRHLDQTSPVEQMTWVPGEPELIHGGLLNEGGWIERKGVTTYNLFRPAIIVPRQGDATRWLKHVKTLYPGAAKHMITWLAHKVQRPAEKINHAIVLGGEQGIGKDTILEPIKQAIGSWNFQDVSPGQVLGRFNGHLKSIILRISEARDLGDANRFALYDHLKAIIAAPPDTLRIDEKNIREYVIPNVTGVIITTNHKVGGIYLPPDDRRHFVAWSPLTRRRFTPKYFMRLYRWYANGGAEIVAHYLATLDISKFNPKAPPPQTEAFWQVVNSNRAPEAAEMADRLEVLGNPAVVTLDQLRVGAPEDFKVWLCDRKSSRAILYRLEDCGYETVRNPDATDGLWRISGKRQVVYGKRDLSLQEKLKATRGMR